MQPDPRGGTPILEDQDALIDPWHHPYQYDQSGAKNGGRRPDIWAVTPEGVQIGNWPTGQ